MAQLRHEYEQFRATNTEIIVIAPNKPASLAKYVNAHPTPFPILSDPGATTAERYGIETIHAPFLTFFIGSMFVVDRGGRGFATRTTTCRSSVIPTTTRRWRY